MYSPYNTLLGLGLTSILSTTATAQSPDLQILQVVWATSSFSTISGTAGNENKHNNGFAITDAEGVELYSEGFPGNNAPCFNTGGGRTFTMTSSCWSVPRRFWCEATFAGDPDKCGVYDTNDDLLDGGQGDTSFKWVGIATTTSSSCGAQLILNPDESCDSGATFEVS